MGETDFGWVNLREPWERLRWARLRKFATAKEFAESIGMRANTYDAREREPGRSRHKPLGAQDAMHFGRRLKVRWEWLLNGEGEPWPDSVREHDPGLSKLEEIWKEADSEGRRWLLDTAERGIRKTGTGG